jgi:hypothetical protein
MSFFENREQEGKTGRVWGLVSVGGGGYKARVKEVSVVEILCTHV